MDEEDIREACGVFGCVASGDWPSQLDVANTICLGLVGLQHRGQESAGIVTTDGFQGSKFYVQKGMGQVNQFFNDETLAKLKGNLGIGHTRYSTAGCSENVNCQPFVVEALQGRISVAHNGELVNAKSLKKKVLEHGVGLSTGTDSELLTQILCLSPDCGEPNGVNWPARIKNLMKATPTSYSLLIMHDDVVYAIRDPYGNRPLCIGALMGQSILSGFLADVYDCNVLETSDSRNGDSSDSDSDGNEGWVVSSESCSFQAIGAKYYREVMPGEIVAVSKYGVKSLGIVPRPVENSYSAFCIFEYVYFARPDSILEGQMVYTVRMRCGEQLAKEAPVVADIVSTVPESATPSALGYSQQTGIPYVEVLCKNRYIGRTFIQPSKRLRQLAVAKKFGALSDTFRGKRIVLVDDSIVRGNTMQPIIRLLKRSGAKEVHIRVASPPVKNPCYMGINIPTKEELIANQISLEALPKFLGADSVQYLSVEGLLAVVEEGIQDLESQKLGHCTACLTGRYPVKLEW